MRDLYEEIGFYNTSFSGLERLVERFSPLLAMETTKQFITAKLTFLPAWSSLASICIFYGVTLQTMNPNPPTPQALHVSAAWLCLPTPDTQPPNPHLSKPRKPNANPLLRRTGRHRWQGWVKGRRPTNLFFCFLITLEPRVE